MPKSQIIKKTFLTFRAKKVFTQLCQAFAKASILQYFDFKCYIRIKTDTSDYTISSALSQLILDNLGQWHPVVYFFRKMILAKTRYKTHNTKLLAIIETFKTWRHYPEGCKHKVLVFINHNNLCHFINIKNLSSR